MREYLEAHDHVSNKKKQEWRAGLLAKSIEEAFKTGEFAAHVTLYQPNTKEILLETKYTPIPKTLIKTAQELGDYLHCSKNYNPPESGFWADFRNKLESAVSELEVANSGKLLGPVLMKKGTKEGILKMSLEGLDKDEWEKKFKKGESLVMNVEFK